MKKCRKCNIDKDSTEFYNNNATKDKLTTWCKPCHREKEKIAHRKDPWKKKFQGARTLYGESMTQELFTKMLTEQNNKCGICNSNMITPYIDHNHSTKKIRMLLCHHCNTLLGMAKQDINILKGAITYIEKFNQ